MFDVLVIGDLGYIVENYERQRYNGMLKDSYVVEK